MWNMISFIFGIVSFAIPKLAIAALLNRLLNPTLIQKSIMWSLTGMVSAIALANIILYLTECKPVEGIFKPLMVASGAATCRDPWILIHFATFNGGARPYKIISIILLTLPRSFSLLRLCRFISCNLPRLRPISSSNVSAQEDCTFSCTWAGLGVCHSNVSFACWSTLMDMST